jgi:hypothetical protein
MLNFQFWYITKKQYTPSPSLLPSFGISLNIWCRSSEVDRRIEGPEPSQDDKTSTKTETYICAPSVIWAHNWLRSAQRHLWLLITRHMWKIRKQLVHCESKIHQSRLMYGYRSRADRSGRAVWGMKCHRSLEHWGRGFKSNSRHRCIFPFILCLS